MGWRVGVGIFLILHGLVHPMIYGPPVAPDAPWETSKSWLAPRGNRSTLRAVAIMLAIVAALAYLLAGIVVLAGADWWSFAAVAASVASLILLLGYFHPWLSFGVLLDGAIIWAAAAGWPE